jgi:hypothetical protein
MKSTALKLLNQVVYSILRHDCGAENTDDKETSPSEFPEVPEEAIVKPEEERPAMSKRPEEEIPGDENKYNDEGIDDSTDMDGDGSPD